MLCSPPLSLSHEVCLPHACTRSGRSLSGSADKKMLAGGLFSFFQVPVAEISDMARTFYIKGNAWHPLISYFAYCTLTA
jgi:hypothetical protein